ncbi:hypothetical protein BC834DRAFT_858453 [Gloeopeniophorella convolvens]|nr:hypothetical protein BC834DRAFT_858453 [Gloeopeniophorella convolvens]
MASLLRSYTALAARRPYLAQCGLCATIFLTADVVAQQVFERRGKQHDLTRTARMSFYGGACLGASVTAWMRFLGKIQFASPVKTALARTGLDQAIMQPTIVGMFFTAMPLLEGEGVAGVKQRVEKAYFPTLVRSWGVYIPAQLVNYFFIPPHLRLPIVGLVTLSWNTYLSALNARLGHHQQETIRIPAPEVRVTTLERATSLPVH